jgi:hypothetical protein
VVLRIHGGFFSVDLLAVRVRERQRREGGLERTIEDDSN